MPWLEHSFPKLWQLTTLNTSGYSWVLCRKHWMQRVKTVASFTLTMQRIRINSLFYTETKRVMMKLLHSLILKAPCSQFQSKERFQHCSSPADLLGSNWSSLVLQNLLANVSSKHQAESCSWQWYGTRKERDKHISSYIIKKKRKHAILAHNLCLLACSARSLGWHRDVYHQTISKGGRHEPAQTTCVQQALRSPGLQGHQETPE